MKERLSLSLRTEDIIELKVAAASHGGSVSSYVMMVHQMYQQHYFDRKPKSPQGQEQPALIGGRES